jgi:hypothetical protein
VQQLKQQTAKGGSNDELQTERLVARRLCREVEVELRQLQPLGSSTTSTSARARTRAEEEEEEDEDDVDQRRRPSGKREREEGIQYKRLKGEFEKMKRRFEEIDDALREREKKTSPRKSSPTKDPSTSIFGELNGIIRLFMFCLLYLLATQVVVVSLIADVVRSLGGQFGTITTLRHQRQAARTHNGEGSTELRGNRQRPSGDHPPSLSLRPPPYEVARPRLREMRTRVATKEKRWRVGPAAVAESSSRSSNQRRVRLIDWSMQSRSPAHQLNSTCCTLLG